MILHVSQVNQIIEFTHNLKPVASFPGPAQLFVTCSTESWAGPGNEANNLFMTLLIEVAPSSVVHGFTLALCYATPAKNVNVWK